MDLEQFDSAIHHLGCMIAIGGMVLLFEKAARRQEVAQLGIWRFLSIIFCSLWLALSPVVPLAGFAGVMILACASSSTRPATSGRFASR